MPLDIVRDPKDNERFLLVPGKWLKSCGMGDTDKVFPVIDVRQGLTPAGATATFATVKTEASERPWMVYVELRNARFVSQDTATGESNA